jgi:hypothetical protein
MVPIIATLNSYVSKSYKNQTYLRTTVPFGCIAKILHFFLLTNKKRKNFTAKVHFFCIIEKVRAMCVPYLKN